MIKNCSELDSLIHNPDNFVIFVPNTGPKLLIRDLSHLFINLEYKYINKHNLSYTTQCIYTNIISVTWYIYIYICN